MAEPFVQQEAPRQALWQRVRRQPDPEGARVAVENLLARAGRVLEVRAGELASLEQRHRVELRLWLGEALDRLFERYMVHCLIDDHMTDAEVEELVHLKRLFGISDRRARELHDESAAANFRAAIRARMEPEGLTSADRAFLEGLRDRLLLSEHYAVRLRDEVASELVGEAADEAAADLRLSPEEEAELEALAANLGGSWPTEGSDAARLGRMRNYWQVDNLDLPVLPVELEMAPDETMHFTLPDVTWVQQRERTGVQRGRVIHRFQRTVNSFLVDRARLRESLAARRQEFTDEGSLYFSNRQIHLTGGDAHRSIPLLRIRSVRPGDRLLRIERVARGPTVVLHLPGQTDTTYVLLTRLIREAHWRRKYQPRLGRGAEAPWWEALE